MQYKLDEDNIFQPVSSINIHFYYQFCDFVCGQSPIENDKKLIYKIISPSKWEKVWEYDATWRMSFFAAGLIALQNREVEPTEFKIFDMVTL